MNFFVYIIPILIVFTFVFALVKKVKAYDSFLVGMKGAIPLLISLFPYLAAMLVLSELFSVSGLEAVLIRVLSPVFDFLEIPPELIGLILIKPLSGSGATAVLAETVKTYGVDSYIGRCACVLFSSSETIFYVGAVYFSACKRKRFTTPILILLFSYVFSVFLTCLLCKVL